MPHENPPAGTGNPTPVEPLREEQPAAGMNILSGACALTGSVPHTAQIIVEGRYTRPDLVRLRIRHSPCSAVVKEIRSSMRERF
jgi:hypothetical protein